MRAGCSRAHALHPAHVTALQRTRLTHAYVIDVLQVREQPFLHPFRPHDTLHFTGKADCGGRGSAALPCDLTRCCRLSV